MTFESLQSAVAQVPPGRWGIGVSGGADSVALVRLLAHNPQLALHVIHLDHQTRGAASTADARSVRELSETLHIPVTVALRETVEATLPSLSPNSSARYRAARLALFRDVVSREHLEGVILAHHADDQADTILQRLIRGSGPSGLAGMSARAVLGGLTILRPLLAARRDDLRFYLQQIGQPWREDASNESDDYLRNRLRRWLRDEPQLHRALIALADACRAAREWARRSAPKLEERFHVDQLGGLPDVLAMESARTWMLARGADPQETTEAAAERLIDMARDAATPPHACFPGSLRVSRRAGIVSAQCLPFRKP
jgi:tRNA(Ile)-lysidine synthetase-like protein